MIWQLEQMDTRALHSPAPAGRRPGMLLEGLRYLRGQPKMLMILVLVFFAGTFGMNFQMTSALMATEVFGKGASEFGLLGSALAVGSLTGALLAARRPKVRVRLLFGAAVGFGVAEIVAGSLPSYLAFALFCPVIGFATITLLNSANATLQVETDPELRGRVMAIYMTIVMGGTPIGAPVIGWIGETYGARWTLIVGGVMVLVGVLLALLVHRLATPDADRDPSPRGSRSPWQRRVLTCCPHEQSGDLGHVRFRPLLPDHRARIHRRTRGPGGLVTFFTMAYIVVLNPLILGFAPDVDGNYLGGGAVPAAGWPRSRPAPRSSPAC